MRHVRCSKLVHLQDSVINIVFHFQPSRIFLSKAEGNSYLAPYKTLLKAVVS